MTIIGDIIIDTCGNDFLLPYLRRELNADDDAEPQVRAAVRIVTDSVLAEPDSEFDATAARDSLPVLVLRCPHIVGTGMQGLMHRIAAGIYRGTYVHITGNVARISVVHAVDVAQAVRLAAGCQGTYTLTDGSDPSIHDLSEAFAYRIGDKRIITIKPRWAKLWYGSRYYGILTSDHVATNTFRDVFTDFTLHPVINYLYTHVYDEQSL